MSCIEKLFKVLYIDSDVDSKASVLILEKCTRESNMLTSFIVVNNSFTGLECTEYTHFDLIFIDNNEGNFGPLEFLKILRTAKLITPVVLLLNYDDLIPDDQIKSKGFHAVLRKPYYPSSLNKIIFSFMTNKSSRIQPMMTATLPIPTHVNIPPSILPSEMNKTTYTREDHWDEDAEVRDLVSKYIGNSTTSTCTTYANDNYSSTLAHTKNKNENNTILDYMNVIEKDAILDMACV